MVHAEIAELWELLPLCVNPLCVNPLCVIARRNDEAIQKILVAWIASLRSQ